MKLATTLLAATAVTLGLGTAAYAADLIIEEPAYVEPIATGGSWDGPFIGVFAGGGWGVADHTSLDPGNDLDLSGWFIGVDAGFNFTVGSGLVIGVVGDVAWADISGADEFGSGDISHTIDWLGSLRGRVGFDGGAFMPYLTGGLAVAHAVRETTDSPFGDGEGSGDETHIGWTVGAGVEFAVTDDVSVDVLYRYSDYGEQVYAYDEPAFTDPTIAMTAHSLQVGLHWNF